MRCLRPQQKKIHDDKGQYCVALSNEDLRIVLDFSKKHVVVCFYNQGNIYLSYDFVKSNAKLFLKAAFHYKHNNKGANTEMHIFNFSEDGTLFIRKQNMLSDEIEECESKVDVSSNGKSGLNLETIMH